MESQLLLKNIYVLANLLILSDTLLFKYFSLYVFFGGNLDSADKFNNMYMSREFWTFYSTSLVQTHPFRLACDM